MEVSKMPQYGMTGYTPVVVLACLAIVVVPFWLICTKAGYSGWLSFLVVIPMVNVFFVYFLGFSDWPSLRGDGPINGGV